MTVNLEDYMPKWQIFVEQPETVDMLIAQWLNPTTIWTGQPVLGFMAETDFDDLAIVGLKDFNPMRSFPSTSVSQNWEHITFGMDASHLKENPAHDKDALVSHSPIVVIKAAKVLQPLGIIACRIVLPSSDVKGGKRIEHTAEQHGTMPTSTTLHHRTATRFERNEQPASIT